VARQERKGEGQGQTVWGGAGQGGVGGDRGEEEAGNGRDEEEESLLQQCRTELVVAHVVVADRSCATCSHAPDARHACAPHHHTIMPTSLTPGASEGCEIFRQLIGVRFCKKGRGA